MAAGGMTASLEGEGYEQITVQGENLITPTCTPLTLSMPIQDGFLFGLVGIFLPQTLGRGEGVMNQVLQGQVHLALLLALLCFAKLITASSTVGNYCRENQTLQVIAGFETVLNWGLVPSKDRSQKQKKTNIPYLTIIFNFTYDKMSDRA